MYYIKLLYAHIRKLIHHYCLDVNYSIQHVNVTKTLVIHRHKHRAYHSWQLVFRNPPDFTREIRMKSGGFHPWNPYEIRRISPVKSVWNPPDFTREIHMKSAGFHLKSARFHEIHMKSSGFHEIHRISWNVSFCVMIKYRSFFRKTKHVCCIPEIALCAKHWDFFLHE